MLSKLVCRALDAQPLWMKERERALTERVLRRPVDPRRPLEPGDVVVCGLMGTASGMGQGARQMLSLFQHAGLRPFAANASRLFALLEDFDAGPLWPPDAGAGGIVVAHVNPHDFHLLAAALGRRFSSRRIVGYWAWELDVIPPQWIRAAVQVDEIWAPSQFVAAALRRALPGKPIHVAPHFIDVESTPLAPRNDPLPDFKDRTIVFFTYDVRSVHARKNPEAAIEAFRRAAADDPNAVLAIKISNSHAWPESAALIQRAISGLTNAHLMYETLSVEQMRDLMARADIVLSLHRSEGFGLLLAEAMAAAKPVIATGWSGNLDFMTPDCSVLVDVTFVPIVDPQHVYDRCEALWAEPDIDQAAKALRRLLDDSAARKRMGLAARAHVAAFFSKEKWLARLPESFWGSLADQSMRLGDDAASMAEKQRSNRSAMPRA